LSGPGSGPVTKPSRETEMSAMIRLMPGRPGPPPELVAPTWSTFEEKTSATRHESPA
jgi:hypothetical protein